VPENTRHFGPIEVTVVKVATFRSKGDGDMDDPEGRKEEQCVAQRSPNAEPPLLIKSSLILT
jgi:hypothetical protein